MPRRAWPAAFCTLNGWFGGVSYSQVLSPVAIAQISSETSYLEGFQGNLYRQVGSLMKYEFLPERRLRNAITPRIAYYFPRTRPGCSFTIASTSTSTRATPGRRPIRGCSTAHMIEARVYQQVTPTLRAPLRLPLLPPEPRQLLVRGADRPTTLPPTQFCAMATDPPSGYLNTAIYYTADPKLGPVVTEYPEVQLVWAADALRTVPFLRWFAAGTFEISYGHYFQNDSFGNAHVLQTGYRLPLRLSASVGRRAVTTAPVLDWAMSSHRSASAPSQRRSLRQVRAAQLRARATRQAIIQMLLGTVFLIGALSYGRAPDRHTQASLAWMSGLLVLSTLDAALGLRAVVRLRLRRRYNWVWMAATAAWALLSLVVLAVLLRG